jgi:hypothetical protein
VASTVPVNRGAWRGALVIALAAVACGGAKDPALTREAVLSSLQQEAQSLKTDGEKLDPKLGVTATWTVKSIEVQEDPDAARPWRGSVRFRIESKTKEWDGSVLTHEFEKTFNYQFDAAAKRWLMR